MRTNNKVVCYIDENDMNPVLDYIMTLEDSQAISNLINVIQRLQRIGLEIVNTKMGKHIEGRIYELIKDRHRILFGVDGNVFILLTAFLKRTQKTPTEEIKIATLRFTEYLKEHRIFLLTTSRE